MSDNSVAVAYLTKQRGTIWHLLYNPTGHIIEWMEFQDIRMSPRYIPLERNMIADLLSHYKEVILIEWVLSIRVFRDLSSVWESVVGLVRHGLEQLAANTVSTTPRFRDMETWCPSTSMEPSSSVRIPSVCFYEKGTNQSDDSLWTLHDSDSSVVATQKPFPFRITDERAYTVRLLAIWNLVVQPLVKQNHWWLEGIKLHTLSYLANQQKTMQERLQVTSENPHWNCSRQNGQPFVIGVMAGLSLHARPLFSY